MEDYTIRELKIMIDEREKALQLQAAEYERRLEALNHAHEQAQERNAEFVSREVFEAYVDSNDAKRDQQFSSINKAVYSITGLIITGVAIVTTILLAHGL